MDGTSLVVALVALAIGGLIGWLFAGRQSGALKAERDGLSERFKGAVTDLAAEAEARKAADIQLAALLSEQRSEEQPSETQSLMRTSYSVFCLKKKTNRRHRQH